MTQWRKINRTWCIWPSRPKELIEMIGGSYLGISPNISYKRLLEGLGKKNIAIHAWNYIPGFDHQAQANEAWKEFREWVKIINPEAFITGEIWWEDYKNNKLKNCVPFFCCNKGWWNNYK